MLAWLLVVQLAGYARAEERPNPLLVEMGELYSQRYCASCHGEAGKGDGPSAPALVVRPPDLTLIAWRRQGRFSRTEIARIIDGRDQRVVHGTREMPIWGLRLAEEDGSKKGADAVARGIILSLVEYLESIQQAPIVVPR